MVRNQLWLQKALQHRHWCECYKTFFSVSDETTEVIYKTFNIIALNFEPYPSGVPLDLSKILEGTNTLAYLATMSVRKKKVFNMASSMEALFHA